ncbi:NAD(P)-binding domain-containing protein [Micromonospora sicca]|uniref:NAD(P)-binding domain-containing protein n=1 Tax=Micromonospora TaxID=1873 RepID=UPI0034CFCE72
MTSTGAGTAEAAGTTGVVRTVGFIGLGDQGLPMAIALVESGYELHVWARRPASMDALGEAEHVRHTTPPLPTSPRPVTWSR